MFYKITQNSVFWICSCGADHETLYSDLKADGVGDVFPFYCDECGMKATACSVTITDKKGINDDVKKRVILNQSLYKRVLEKGTFFPRRGLETIDKVQTKFLDLALDDPEVEAPLPSVIKRAKRIRENPDLVEESREQLIAKAMQRAKEQKEQKEKEQKEKEQKEKDE